MSFNRKLIIKFFLIFFLFLFILYLGRLIFEIKLNRDLSQWKKEQQVLKEKSKSEWEKIYRYSSSTENKKNTQSSEKITKTKGLFYFNFIYVKPKNLTEEIIQPLLAKLQSKEKYYSSSYIEEYYQKEAQKYGVSDFKIKINHYGPFTLDHLPYAGDIFNPWYKDPFSTVKIKDTFNKVLSENKINTLGEKEKNFYFFIYFDPEIEKEEKVDEYSFYDYKKFRSFADYNNKKAYINVYDFSSLFAKKLVTILLHESLHLFGANDKYYENPQNDRLCSEKGRGFINKLMYFPQKTGDIMCLYVEYEEGKFRPGDLEKEELVINEETAKEIGWLNK